MNRIIICTMVFCINLFLTLPCYGNIYVKNLHKKCVSNQQKCFLSCSNQFPNDIKFDSISPEALICADTCLNEYIACEEALERLRYLYDAKPLPEDKTHLYNNPEIEE